MEEKLYKLEVLYKIKNAISSQYNEIDKASIYHECMEMLLDIENDILNTTEE